MKKKNCRAKGIMADDECVCCVLIGIFCGVGILALTCGVPYCWMYECCRANSISLNTTKLKTDLENRIIAQHVASPIILKMVTRHMKNPNPKKALVLSLHGNAGTGKNFMSQLIAESIYYNGMNSKFVHLFIATKDFPHQAHLQTYKKQLEEYVKEKVTQCPNSMFIFDEMDKMLPGLIDAINPFLDFHVHVDGIDFRQAIFIFLSNAGGMEITEVALDFWKKGRKREEITLIDLEDAISHSVFHNKNSGFWKSSLINQHLVDVYVPFLPMEYKHVIRCGLAEMTAKGLWPNLDVAENMAKDYVYYPKEERLFSVQGCKMITQRLDFYL